MVAVSTAAAALADDKRSSHIEKYSSSQSQPAPIDVADDTTDGSEGGDALIQQTPPCVIPIKI